MDDLNIEITLILGLCVWRVTRFLVQEDGPYSIFIILRSVLFKAGLQKIFLCFHCSAVWIATLISLVVLPLNGLWLVAVFSISAVASIVQIIITNYQYYEDVNERE